MMERDNEFDLSGALEGSATAEVIPGHGEHDEMKEQ